MIFLCVCETKDLLCAYIDSGTSIHAWDTYQWIKWRSVLSGSFYFNRKQIQAVSDYYR